MRKWLFAPKRTEERNKGQEKTDFPSVALTERDCSHQGSGWIAFVGRGGAAVEGGQTSSTEVEQWPHTHKDRHTHTYIEHTQTPGSPAEEGGGVE